MAIVHVSYYTDPACPWSWAAEPALRRLEAEFGEALRITYIMGGLAREFRAPLVTMRHVLDAGQASGMPVDPRLWLDHPPRSSYPACQAVKAAAEQGLDASYLRVVREGLMARRQKLDTADALIGAAREVAGLDIERFAIDLHSNAIVEAFGADLERARAAAREGERRVPFPSFCFRGEDESEHWVRDEIAPDAVRAAALAAGARPAAALPGADEALRRFGRMATPEVAAVCELPGPLAAAQLWQLAAEWKVRPQRAVAGELWQSA
jgi:predicted DsbA family dithiol-disulfide isomerase